MSAVESSSASFRTAAVLSIALLFSVQAGAAESPLRAHLQAKAAAIEAQKASAVKPQAIHAQVIAESRSGVRRLRLGDEGKFQYISDSGRSFAGYNLGAGSWDSLVGTLASAVADEYLVQAAARKVPLDSLDIVFTSIPERKSENLSYPNNLSYVAYIVSPASDAELEALKQAVHANSSVINLVTKAQNVSHATVEYKQTSIVRDKDQPPGLRDFLVEEKIPAVQGRRQRREAGTQTTPPRGLVAHTHVEPTTGLRQTFLGEDGYHLQLHDSAPGLLGYDLAPTVEEHLLGVTGTCLTHIFEVQAATRNVLLDSLELTVDAELTPRFGKGVTAPARFRNITYKVRIESPESEKTIDELRQAVEATCPLYNLVKDEQTLEGKIVRSAYKKQSVSGGVATPQTASDFRNSHAAWVKEREAELIQPDGWTSLIGLHWVEGGQQTVGGAESNDIRLRIGPDKLGKVERRDGSLFFSAEAGAGVTLDGKPLQGGVQLIPEGRDGGTRLGYDGGKGQLTVIDRKGKLALRVRHADSPERLNFEGLDVFAPDEQWQVKAAFVAHPPGKTITMANIIGDVNESPNPGYVEFERNGQKWKLEAQGDPAKGLSFVFKDATSGKETYGVARFLKTGPVAADGTVVVDFNRAYNPPCAFTEYATCPLPPKENQFALKNKKGETIRLAVLAGEKKYAAAH